LWDLFYLLFYIENQYTIYCYALISYVESINLLGAPFPQKNGHLQRLMVMTEHRQWRIREVPLYLAAHALEGWWGLNIGCGMKAMAGHCWDGSGVLGGHQLAGWCAAGVSLGGGALSGWHCSRWLLGCWLWHWQGVVSDTQ
jgi:hypothetical protein